MIVDRQGIEGCGERAAATHLQARPRGSRLGCSSDPRAGLVPILLHQGLRAWPDFRPIAEPGTARSRTLRPCLPGTSDAAAACSGPAAPNVAALPPHTGRYPPASEVAHPPPAVPRLFYTSISTLLQDTAISTSKQAGSQPMLHNTDACTRGPRCAPRDSGREVKSRISAQVQCTGV